MALFEFDPPERFITGTVGPPGERTFFLQVRGDGRLTSMSIEKFQVSVLADRITDLLNSVGVPADAAPADNEPLGTPIEDEFRVNTLSLSWDPERAMIVIECHDRDPDEEAPHESVRVVLPPSIAREFARRTAAVVAAGRPPCPFCGGPLDPTGHICPRANGYKR